MITDADIDQTLAKIDAALLDCPAETPVSFGTELFAALVRRGLICDHLPAPIGEEAVEALHPSTFRETHPARVDVRMESGAYSIGAGAKAV